MIDHTAIIPTRGPCHASTGMKYGSTVRTGEPNPPFGHAHRPTYYYSRPVSAETEGGREVVGLRGTRRAFDEGFGLGEQGLGVGVLGPLSALAAAA